MENPAGHSTQVFETNPVAVHTLWNGWKHLKNIGHLIVYENNDGTYWANINHGWKHELIKESVFYKLVYKTYTSYLKEAIKGGFVVISF